jgi:hypothetical protein
LFSKDNNKIKTIAMSKANKYRKRIYIRVDDRTSMLLRELSEITEESISVIARSMITREIDLFLDKEGYFNIERKKRE